MVVSDLGYSSDLYLLIRMGTWAFAHLTVMRLDCRSTVSQCLLPHVLFRVS